MTDPSAHRRRTFLFAWASAAAARGYPVPSDDDLQRMADAGSAVASSGSVEVRAWWRTLEHLLKQDRFGAIDPHLSLPSALLLPDGLERNPGRGNDIGLGRTVEPTPTSPDSVPPAPDLSPEDTVLAALKRWREEAIAAQTPGITPLTETHLKLVARSGKREAEDLRATFAPIVRQFADEIAAVIATVAATSSPASDATPSPSPLPEAGPTIAVAPHAPAPPPAPSDVDPDSFAPFAYGTPEGVPTSLKLTPGPGGSVRAVWNEYEESGVAVYRLIAADENAPYSPEDGRMVAATREHGVLDDEPFEHAVRHFQVWRNVGRDVDDAVLEQPSLHSFGAVIAPALDVDIREDEGRVIGRWRALPGTTRVQVFRIPRSRGGMASGDPQYRIVADDANLGGFVDPAPARGEKYLYQVFAEAVIDGVPRLSAPTSIPVDISVVHEPVLDLAFDLHDDAEAPFFDLAWSVPRGGEVVVYRTTEPPSAGIERKVQPESVLPQANLNAQSRLAHPITTDDARASMRDVPWPRGWTRAYFTVVVLLDGNAYVGNTVRGVRVPPVAQLRLIERVDRQRVTFEWPDGADVVLAYTSPVGLDSELAVQGEPKEISRSAYFERGSLEYRTGELDASGCELHLVSASFDGGRRVHGAARRIVYPGLLRLGYRCTVKRSLMGKYTVTVSIWSEVPLESAPPFVLVHHPERFPLTIGDGTALAMVPDIETVASPVRRFVPGPMGARTEQPGWRTDTEAWSQDVPHPTGFVRLFVDLPTEYLRRVALLDPPVDTLRVQSLREKVSGLQNRVLGG
ncbi:hypothetical protein HQQ80_11820 [Microbacteriaceae bacterium VKM Ac-2855]|nr:hypothetical protein [Microbacteriaceae bacterium VKM Ac-2855]